MKILGLQKTTLLDYPGIVASTVFLSGCNMRCSFCHNMNLIINNNIPSYSQKEILEFLSSRKGIIDGVCITGGEPTIHPDLPDFISSIRSTNLNIKLDTNGTNPKMLEELLSSKLVDYIAMDIKSSLNTYRTVCQMPDLDLSLIEASIDIIRQSCPNYEFRTTLVKEFHTEDVMRDIGFMLEGANQYFLQSFLDSEYVPDHSLNPCDKNTIMNYQSLLSEYIEYVGVRGI